MKQFICLLLMAASFGKLPAQNWTGLNLDNYAGSTAMALNPAAPLKSPNPWEVNLISAGVFFQNNYIYFQQQSLLSLTGNLKDGNVSNDPDISWHSPQRVRGAVNLFAQGPSFYIRKNDFSIGLVSRTRIAGSLSGEAVSGGMQPLDNIPVESPVTIPSFHAAMLAWTELGISAAKTLRQFTNQSLSAGITIKFMAGMEGLYFKNLETFVYSTHTDSTNSITNMYADFGFTNSLGSNAVIDPSNAAMNGSGLGADLGILYMTGEGETTSYRFALGISMNDIGKISFSKNAETYLLTEADTVTYPAYYQNSIDDIDEFTRNASYVFNDQVQAVATANAFEIWAPLAISLQADQAIGRNFFIGAILTQRIPLFPNQVEAVNSLVIAPRYESRWLSAGIPFSFYEWNKAAAGLWFRVGPLTLGSDQFSNWLIRGKFSGTDIYMGIRVFPFQTSISDTDRMMSKKRESRTNCPADIR